MSPLIYDLGLHDGTDTAHYLEAGARVVAVDANPTMCSAAEETFRDYIRTGQLTILNRGLAEHTGQLTFWVCDDHTEWSSFHQSIASRNGSKHHSIVVDCSPLTDVIAEFGVPDFMKIDLEGNDRICIAGLNQDIAPRYISIEMDHEKGDQDIRRLAELGYRDFKVICQNNSWHQVTVRNVWIYEKLRAYGLAARVFRRLCSPLAKVLYGINVGGSGPWGEKTPGSWHSSDHALAVWRSLHELDKRSDTPGVGWWFDVHARK
jgi:FkbM family methyltransferase